ncbi:MAG: VWA domain-containing protein [Methanomassiliicoccales archaeon]|nr:MAG: VWA domain-containing protein [Methanomassiliicoccales archaeon]
MTLKIKIVSPHNPKPVTMEIEPNDYIEDIIDSVADFWELDAANYLIKRGSTVYSKDLKIMETNIKSGTVFEFVTEKDIVERKKRKIQDIEDAKKWLSENIGSPSEKLDLIGDIQEKREHFIIFEDSTDKSRYGMVIGTDEKVEEFQLLTQDNVQSDASSGNFDSVLLLDISGSTKSADIQVGEMVHEIDGILTGEFFEDFLSKFEEGRYVKRYEVAALCALIYLLGRIKSSKEDKTAVVPFSDDSNFVWFEGDPYFSSDVEDVSKAAEGMVKKIQDTWHGTANLIDGLNKSIALIKNFDRRKIKNILIFLDGKADEEEAVLDLVKGRLGPRYDVVINTIGWGSEIDDDFMTSLSEMAQGQYSKVSDFNDLLNIYKNYASELKIKDLGEKMEKWQKVQENISKKVTAPKTCPECDLGLSFLYKEKKWYCYNCQKYL